MAVTRSSKKQTRIEDFPTTSPKAPTKKEATPKAAPATNSTKRKSTASSTFKQSPAKKAKSSTPSRSKFTPAKQPVQQQTISTSNGDLEPPEKPVLINRAPVLQLWAACVAQVQHRGLSWPACVNIGSAISTLCAMSKGKAIGAIEPKDKSPDEEAATKERKEKAKEGAETVEVMGFSLHMKGDAVVLGGQKKEVKEESLVGKFGGEETYETVKEVMYEAVKGWKGNEEELAKKAFRMYEQFRPNVPKGQKGWGRKGELILEDVRTTAKT